MFRIRSFGCSVLFGIGLIGCGGADSSLNPFDGDGGSGPTERIGSEGGGDRGGTVGVGDIDANRGADGLVGENDGGVGNGFGDTDGNVGADGNVDTDGSIDTDGNVGTDGSVDTDGGVDTDGSVGSDGNVGTDGSDGVDDGSSDAAGDAGGADGPSDAATGQDSPNDSVNSGDDASNGSTDSLADAPPEGGADDAASTDAAAASDTNDQRDSTDTSDAKADAVDDAGEAANDGTPDNGDAPATGDAGAHPDADASPPAPPGPLSVGITWASIANVYLELGSTSVLINGYITRLPATDFYGGGGGLAFTHTNYSSDETAIGAVLTALGGPTRFNWLFTGHSHWDHSFDTATWARLTGAPIYGPRTTCFEARAEGTPMAGCTAIVGGEKLHPAPGVTVRVVRWNHSGDSATNPEQHNPVELQSVPTPDAQGRLRAGVAEDFPNGGGSRGFLFTIDSAAGAYSFFFEDSAGAGDLTQPIVVDGVNYGAPLSNLAAALTDASLTHVDLWIATGGPPVAQLVVPMLHPKAYLPIHWDGLFRGFHAGAPVFSDNALSNYLASQNVQLVTPVQYMDKWSLSPSGIAPVDNKQVQHALGF